MARPFRSWEGVLDRLVDDTIHERVDRLDIRLNAFGYDRWGASPAAAKRLLALVRVSYERYFRVECHGLENVPAGRVLMVSNHSTQLAYDGMLICAAMVLEANPPRFVRAMIERFFANPAYVNVMMSRMGQLIGIPANCRRLLQEEDAAVLVFPEGERGGGKVFRDRYKIMGFGQGFMRLALQTKTPVLPIGFIGGEEMVPSFSRMTPLAKLMGMPYAPLTPTLLPLPLPTKVHIFFGEPMHFDGTGTEEDHVLRSMVEKVESAVADLLAEGLRTRKGVFFS